MTTNSLRHELRVRRELAHVHQDLGHPAQMGPEDTSPVKSRYVAMRALSHVGSFFKKAARVTTVSILTLATSPIIVLVGLAHATVKARFSSASWKKVTIYVFNTYFYDFLSATGLRSFTRFSKINERIYLGAVPTHGSFLKNLQKEGITAVISLTEDFELNTSSLTSTPVTPSEWVEKGIQFTQCPSEDFKAVDLTTLNKAADAIKGAVDSGGKVYIHCKAGLGRSPCALAAYYIKHKHMSVEDAIDLIEKQRPSIRLSNNHRNQVEAFKTSLDTFLQEGPSVLEDYNAAFTILLKREDIQAKLKDNKVTFQEFVSSLKEAHPCIPWKNLTQEDNKKLLNIFMEARTPTFSAPESIGSLEDDPEIQALMGRQ